jgi:hypothetical protein
LKEAKYIPKGLDNLDRSVYISASLKGGDHSATGVLLQVQEKG